MLYYTWFAKFILIICNVWTTSLAVQLTAHFSDGGIHGQVALYQDPNPGARPIHLTVDLTNRNEFEGNQTWTWFIAEFPVDYSVIEDRCSSNYIGGIVADLGDLFGPISFSSNESVYFEFESGSEEQFALVGSRGVWGRSLVLVGPSQEKLCGTIVVTDEREEWVAEARFQSGVAGSVFFRWVGSLVNNVTDNAIFSSLQHISNQTASEHPWKIFITDILDSEADKSRATCDFLQILFNPGGAEPAVGDLSARLGEIRVGQPRSRFSKSPRSLYRDTGLSLLPADLLGGRRSLYLVIFDHKHKDSFLACAKIRTHRPVVLKALIQSGGVSGMVTMSQRTQFNPTWLTFNLTAVQRDIIVSAGCKVNELPPDPGVGAVHTRCTTTGPVFDPKRQDQTGFGSQDRYAVGDLSGKHGRQHFIGEVIKVWDAYLPLYGPDSVAHRSIVFFRYFDSIAAPWICGTLHRYKSVSSTQAVAMTTATAVYRYPIVGTVMFRQPAEQPWADTTVFVEMMVHADGLSVNDTLEHRWSINEFPPGPDFYNWSMRCVSAGNVFNLFKVSYDEKRSTEYCSRTHLTTCRLGDLTNKLGTLGIAGSIKAANRLSRRIFTDSSLPLSGVGSVVGKSLVIFDDHGPVARGDRLACSKIERDYRRKAVVKNWFSNGKRATVTGKMEFLQQNKYDVTNVDVSVEGLVETSGYHIHMVPVHEQLEFPCEDSTLYGHYNPVGVNPQNSPIVGTPDQYETGDLSGKFGALDGKTTFVTAYNDTTVTLFGPLSVLGRSVVIHKKVKNSRWVCSSIERGYAPSEARELRAIASFHHPGGFAYGYVRMTQLVYRDNSKSDTIIEVNLRYPGKNDRNLTLNHNWAIYVNPVSVDATVQILNTRCTAGGYVWNPYYTQLADPLNEDLYRAECGPENPLRCYVGDVSSRLGTIDVGGKRKVFTDGNFPLEGAVSAMGRSIVVFTPERGGDRMACANIAPDNDIIKYANIRSSPGFVADLFLEEFREIMGIPEWFLTVDTRQTKSLYQGNCMQFLLHFKGPDATKLEQDFSHLLSTGSLAQPSIYIPGYFISAKRKSTTSFRPCGNEDPLEAFEKKNRRKNIYFSSGANSQSLTWYLAMPLTFVMMFNN